ncbi:MAG: hypothetical protein Q8L34_01600, partial [Candidatus Woesearchaeota archaeon]|nr:hypothetical protein [Candidatus Woesearchaeota archaeon]
AKRFKDYGGSEPKRGGRDYKFRFHDEDIGVFVTHDEELTDHGIKQIADGMIHVYEKENPKLKSDKDKIRALRTEIINGLRGRARPYRETVPLKDLGSALEDLGASVSYEEHKLRVLIGDKYTDVKGNNNDEVTIGQYNTIAQKVADFYDTDLNDVLTHLPKPKKKSSGLEDLLGKTAVVLAAFALFTALVWTGSTYTGASTTAMGYKVGYYGIIAIIISFYALVMFFHKLYSK